MPTYAIGDIQGCLDPLLALLEEIGYDERRDTLWLAGDLVNRGPQSLETLRFLYRLPGRLEVVLGNHDLHAIALYFGGERLGRNDNLEPLLEAPDSPALLEWLRHRPLLHHDPRLGVTMVHAGLPPQWDLEAARARATEAESVLQGEGLVKFLKRMYGNLPVRWSDDLEGWDRLRLIVNCFTRMRYVHADGSLDLEAKGPPGSQPEGLYPWFRAPDRRSGGMEIVFGHWSTLGAVDEAGVHSLDTGCLWGGRLTALRLEDMRRFTVPCQQYRPVE